MTVLISIHDPLGELFRLYDIEDQRRNSHEADQQRANEHGRKPATARWQRSMVVGRLDGLETAIQTVDAAERTRAEGSPVEIRNLEEIRRDWQRNA